MLSAEAIKDFAVQWQTSQLNVAREYVQHLFLSYLYQLPESEHLAFKGGTALRLIFKSPRFSEDLDFTGRLKPFHLSKALEKVSSKIAKENVSWEVRESKPTSGGYLAHYECRVYNLRINIELNISLRGKSSAEPVLVTNPLIPHYQCLILMSRELAKEKIEALLFRKKSRDFYDLYFLLRERLGIDAIIPRKAQLMSIVTSLNAKMLQQELKAFLPTSHQRIIANLPQALVMELNRL